MRFDFSSTGTIRTASHSIESGFLEMQYDGAGAYLSWAGDSNLDFKIESGNLIILNQSGVSWANGGQNAIRQSRNRDAHNALYGMTSTEAWFEDFGSAELDQGFADVAIDPDFMEVVNTAADYYVYLTPTSDDLVLLVVLDKTAEGFTVKGGNLDGTTAVCAFDYRIV